MPPPKYNVGDVVRLERVEPSQQLPYITITDVQALNDGSYAYMGMYPLFRGLTVRGYDTIFFPERVVTQRVQTANGTYTGPGGQDIDDVYLHVALLERFFIHSAPAAGGGGGGGGIEAAIEESLQTASAPQPVSEDPEAPNIGEDPTQLNKGGRRRTKRRRSKLKKSMRRRK